MNRFNAQNTDGYTTDDLRILNAAWDSLPISAFNEREDVVRSVQDHVAERLLLDFDIGLRGDDLVAAYYATLASRTSLWATTDAAIRIVLPRLP